MRKATAWVPRYRRQCWNLIQSTRFSKGSVVEREKKNLVLKGRRWGVTIVLFTSLHVPPVSHRKTTQVRVPLQEKNEAFFPSPRVWSHHCFYPQRSSLTPLFGSPNMFPEILGNHLGCLMILGKLVLFSSGTLFY